MRARKTVVMTRLWLTGLLALTAVAIGCGGEDPEPPPADPAQLRGGQWSLLAGAGIAIATTGGPTVEFSADRVNGNDGCNNFSTDYKVKGATMRFGEQQVSTMIACDPEAGDEAFNAALAEVAEWTIDDGELILSDTDAAELLRFEPATPAGHWRALSLLSEDAVTTLPEGVEITAELSAEDGSLSGSAGCNEYGGSFKAGAGGRIAIRELFATEMACTEPEGVMELEQSYLEAIPRTAAYRLDGDQMTLLSRAGTILVVFEPAP